MANTEVGSAYVTVYPQTDGKFSNKVGKDIGSNVEKGLSAKTVAIGNLISTGITKAAGLAAEGIGSVIGGAMSNFADYEQLTGGIETLFKDSADMVKEYASQAYQSAGLSANEYMDTVTSFSASLLQSLGGDTEAAARYADMAVRDMSDNANKMGTDMASIQNAYQGFAKQNYTMLDNLKLGYGGTKSEMERLLADAEAISGVHYDISQYADVVEAIHVVQTEMGITGTTAEEAAQTISGSVNAMKASWQNWLTALATDDVDMSQATDALLDSITTVASNVIPRLANVASSIIASLPDIASRIADAIPQLGGMISDAFSDMMADAFGADIDVGGAFGGAIDGIASTFESMMPVIEDIVSNVGTIIEGLAPIVEDVADTIGTTVSAVMETVLPIIDSITSAVADNMPTIQAVVGTVMDFLQTNVTSNLAGVQAVFETVWPIICSVVDTAVGIIKGAIDGLRAVVDTVSSIFEGVKHAIEDPMGTAQSIVEGAISTIEGIISGANLQLPSIPLPHFNIDGGEAPWGIGGAGRRLHQADHPGRRGRGGSRGRVPAVVARGQAGRRHEHRREREPVVRRVRRCGRARTRRRPQARRDHGHEGVADGSIRN